MTKKYVISKIILIIFTFSFIVCCSKNRPDNYNNIPSFPELPESQKTVLALELEHHFDNSHVVLRLDNELILSDNITTDYTISAAWLSGPFECPISSHTIYITHVDKSVSAAYKLALLDTTTVRIKFNLLSNKFEFIEQEGLFLQRD